MNEVNKYYADHAGRGPTGRLRNFGAMADNKLQAVYETVRVQNNDMEALTNVQRHLEARALWKQGVRVAPPSIPQDVWDTLEALAL